jgi:hypothetical protein
MFDDYKQRRREYARANQVKFSVAQSVAILFVFTVAFRNIFAGLAGAAVTLLGALYWWRPGGPGARRLEGREKA